MTLIKFSNWPAFIKVAICERFLFPNVNVYFQIKLHICFSRDEMKLGFGHEKEFSSCFKEREEDKYEYYFFHVPLTG